MIELIMQLNCHFTEADKEKCLPTIHKLIELANLARTKGILAIEAEAHQTPSLFLKTALLLVVDGTDPIIVKQILQNLILADKYSASHLLDRLLIAEGVLAIQQGENPCIIVMRLCSMLGEKYMPEAKDEFPASNEKMRKYYDFLKTLNGKVPLPESAPFEAKFSHLDNRSLQYIMRGVDIQVLTRALSGCGFNLVYKVLENVSMNVCLQICENLKLYKSLHTEDILAAQGRITAIYEALINTGEIIVLNS